MQVCLRTRACKQYTPQNVLPFTLKGIMSVVSPFGKSSVAQPSCEPRERRFWGDSGTRKKRRKEVSCARPSVPRDNKEWFATRNVRTRKEHRGPARLESSLAFRLREPHSELAEKMASAGKNNGVRPGSALSRPRSEGGRMWVAGRDIWWWKRPVPFRGSGFSLSLSLYTARR